MFSRILIEQHLENHPRALELLERFPHIPIKKISRVEDIFGRVKKPYLQKREDLQLFIGEKRGNLIKEAPEAYGLSGDSHYYFVHAYNCIYECEYCYLQGYFNSPDLVFFINHEDILKEMDIIYSKLKDGQSCWFHAGEFSDSLALSHLSGELPIYFDYFRDRPLAKLELRTKSANIRELLKLRPAPNVMISFSLSSKERLKRTDRGTPPLDTRLKAMVKLQEHGHPLGIHFDPIVYEDDFSKKYEELIESLSHSLELSKIEYFSLGVVRFTSSVFQQVKKNYPESDLLSAEFISSFDHKIRYQRPTRLWMLDKIKSLLLSHGVSDEKIYLCME